MTDLEMEAQAYIERRNALLKDISPEDIRKGWFTLSHLLIDDGATVVEMGCGNGIMAYVMAAMKPKITFIGLDKDKRRISKAKERFKLPNLDYKIGDVSSDIFEEESVDAIINSYILHHVYSHARYNPRVVSETLRKHFKMLKKGGMMFIQDYASPPPEEFVLMEMPDTESEDHSIAKMSEADLLVTYSEDARPKQDAGCGGFFLEELPERFPRTRLFRLPHKWAYEFALRKDDRAHWEETLPLEYTFFTVQDFRKELHAMGARVQYSGPLWDEAFVEKNFEGKFRLYENDGTPLSHPPTSFIAVAYKLPERKSLNIEERRPSSVDSGHFKITAMRDQNTGTISDVVSRDLDLSEVLPYRINEHGRLKIYLHDGTTRSIANTVTRGGMNIDGRRWSGHMIEPISVDSTALSYMKAFDHKHTVLFSRDHIGLKPVTGAILEKGPDYYPAPDYIDEKIHTFYLQVEKNTNALAPRSYIESEKFQNKGHIREMDAQQVLNAITVGMIPNARLELQILTLFQHLKIKAETWTDKHLNLQASEIKNKISSKTILDLLGMKDERFKEIKGTSGQLRAVHSLFVEEGQSRGAVSGLSSENIDFIIHDDKTINTAVVLPLTKDLKGNVHAGIMMKYLPIPQRHEGNGLTVSAPSFNIPPEVTDLKQLKKFIADEFGVLPANVLKLGESYFSHVGVTPHRIYPFAVSSPPETMKYSEAKFLPFYQLLVLKRLLSKEPHFMMAIARAYRYFHEELRFDAKLQVKEIIKQRFEGLQPDWSIPINYHSLEDLKHMEEHAPQKIMEARAQEEAKHKHDEEDIKHKAEELKHKEEEDIKRKLEGEKAKEALATKKPALAEKIHAFLPRLDSTGLKKHIPFHGGTLSEALPTPPVVVPAPLPAQEPAPVPKQEAPDYGTEDLGEDVQDYESEFEAFLDVLEEHTAPKPEGPVPEKW